MIKIVKSIGSMLNTDNKSDLKSRYFDLDECFFDFYEVCKPYTMLSIERLYANYKAIEYIVVNEIAGSVVECGVWKGGSMMLMAKTLMNLGDAKRTLYLYDTFEGMTEPSDKDRKRRIPKVDLITIGAIRQLRR